MRGLIGEAKTRLKRLVEGIVIVAIAGASEYLAAFDRKVWETGRRQGVADIWIQPIHAVEPFGARQR